MKNKRISLVVNSEDVRSLIGNVLSLIISRENVSRAEAIQDLNEKCKEGDSEDIMAAMARLIEIAAQTARELQNMSPLVNDLNKEEELLPADTEVVEDLPDLQEDSSGVDGGGE
jgi:uncharacterized membrane protein YccC